MASTTHDTSPAATAPPIGDGFEVLDACPIQTVFALGKLAALVARLAASGRDAEARAMAAEIASRRLRRRRAPRGDTGRHVRTEMQSAAGIAKAAK